MEQYYIEDFTEENYARLLELIPNPTYFYDEVEKKRSFTLWRHDVDFSVHRALRLAEIETEKEVKATYFFQLGCMFYNLFETEIREKVKKIHAMGHSIGLHFDPTQYAIDSVEALERWLSFEKETLEQLFGVEIKVFSFHNPTPEILAFDQWSYAGMINTYANYFRSEVAYCSDSNGYWRHERLEDFLKQGHVRIQVLTHPAWWQKEAMPPQKRIRRCIEGRKQWVEKKYDELLEIHGRNNIDK